MLTEQELKIKTGGAYSHNVIVAKTLGVFVGDDIVHCQYLLYIRGEEISLCSESKFNEIVKLLESKGYIVKFVSETLMPPC